MIFKPRTEIGLSQNLLSGWTGQFNIIARINLVNYRMENVPHVFHVQRLRVFIHWDIRIYHWKVDQF